MVPVADSEQKTSAWIRNVHDHVCERSDIPVPKNLWNAVVKLGTVVVCGAKAAQCKHA
jgi:hypothetical protein